MPIFLVNLDVLEGMLDALDSAAGGDTRWAAKRREFASLTSMGQFLEMRSEFAVACALASAGIKYELGKPGEPNPDFLILPTDGGASPVAGVEVVSAPPPGINELSERIVEELQPHSGLGVHMVFSRYPSRLRSAVVDEVIAAVHDQASPVAVGGSPEPVVIDVGDVVINAGPLTVTVHVRESEEWLGWEVAGADLTGPMSSALYAAVTAGRSPAKAAQGRSLDGVPVLLLVDLSRYGAAWMRSDWVWAGALAASEEVTADYPFAGIGVFQQRLGSSAVVGMGVGLSPHLGSESRQAAEELCDALGWARS
ncbi:MULTISPECIES: hypothetical protein [Streptomyces]|uniref:Uncharacterized protein n=1 Tax=Streptomyces sudanensis TaxID=436397 RepID=A0ABY4TIG7_9ACTN|nr:MULTISPECIES: hypothetical protein [Streptomyces]MCP9956086.1 hypothetical protein [Streptomyces sudanensis]MCQ0003278.1 hypothetical protein [Streptomyces sudanensis]URN18547.1 hypothetical protein MW084_24220 [Streptomyces sudanensis]